MRQNIGRLTAAGIAILIGTAFIAATLLAGQVFIGSQQASMTTKLAEADLAVRAASFKDGVHNYNSIDQALITKLSQTDGVLGLAVGDGPYATLSAGARSEYLPITTYSDISRLQTFEVSQGKAPSSTSEIALPAKFAERMGKSIGDSIDVDLHSWLEEPSTKVSMTVSGFVEDPRGAFASAGGTAVTTLEGLETLAAAIPNYVEGTDSSFHADTVLLALDPEQLTDPVAFESTKLAIAEIAGDRSVQTIPEVATEQLEMLSGEAALITNMVLAFAFLALLVASLVISNTFQVLVAQRTKTLAMLRCVGASKKQVRSSVVIEALILGAIASVIGIVVGIALVQAILWVVAALEISPNVPSTISLTAMVIWLPLVAGILTTLVASFVPAKIATQVSPLAALRPVEGSSEVRRTGLFRTILAGLLVLGGVALFAVGFARSEEDPSLGLLAGIAGGAISFVGLIVSAVLWVPGVVAGVGKLFERFGASAQIATANVRRNPRRTASTATALFIGVTLVAMLSIGASTARETLNKELDAQFPLDMTLTFENDTQVDVNQINAIEQIDGIAEVAAVRSIPVIALPTEQDGSYYEHSKVLEFNDQVAATMRDETDLAPMTDGKTLIAQGLAPLKSGTEISFVSRLFLEDITTQIESDSTSTSDDSVSVTLDDADSPNNIKDSEFWSNRAVASNVGVSGLDAFAVNAKTFAETAQKLGYEDSDIATSLVFIKVEDPDNAMAAVDELREMFGEDAVTLSGTVLERNEFQKVINVMLLVLVGLLGVAVIIALVGVANTLSLSVIERRRESATLRAVGMSRRQLRTSLALEGMLIAGIGAFVGVLLGGLYGWLGADLVLGALTDPVFTVRWLDIGLIFAVAIGAGLIASIVPGRAAARTSPVEALAVD